MKVGESGMIICVLINCVFVKVEVKLKPNKIEESLLL